MKAPQRIAEAVGASGCYFLSLLRLAEERMGVPIDILKAYEVAVSRGLMRPDCYVEKPADILELYLPGAWDIRKEDADYVPAPEELEILRFELALTGETKAHFVVGDGLGRIAFDPYGDSRTCREGRLASKRIARRL